MKKIKTLLKAPILTQSGYGAHSRLVFYALFSDPTFDLYVEGLNWGHTPFLTEDTEEKRIIQECIKKFHVAQQHKFSDWDLFIHLTIPNEFETLGKVNVGITAGIETDTCSANWIQNCEKMDAIIVPSEHSKKVLENTVVQWHNPQTNERGTTKLSKPVFVCAEGVDCNIFKPYRLNNNAPAEIVALQNKFEFEPEFCFLNVGLWGQGGFGEDRKDISSLIKYFIETFYGRKDVGLVLKTSMGRNSVIDYQAVVNRIQQIKAFYEADKIPSIYVIHGNLSSEEMVALYNHPKIKAYVSFTHGEGYGLPLLEAAACGLPVIATNWSGHLDFLGKNFTPVNYTLKEIPESVVWDPILIKGSKWAVVDEEHAKNRLNKIVRDYYKPQEKAKELAETIPDEYDLQVVSYTVSDTIKQALSANDRLHDAYPAEYLSSLVDTPDNFNILFTMPRSNGDVFISTAVIDGLMKEVRQNQPDAKLYFATSPQYFPILKNNPNIYKCVEYKNFMMMPEVSEEVFDLVQTPDTATQYQFSNWVKRGNGRLLAEEYASHCNVTLGEYFIETEELLDFACAGESYMTIHVGSGEGQWEGRKYEDWKEVLLNVKNLYPDLKVVQVGAGNDMQLLIDCDLRGKTNVNQMAHVLKGAVLHLGIDSFPMHVAAALKTPVVALFGCSYANATGPWTGDDKDAKLILLESERRTCGCKKACYKNKPIVNVDYGTLNEIDPKTVFGACQTILKSCE